MVYTINKALKENSLPEEQLKKTLQVWWPSLKDTLDALPTENSSQTQRRPIEDMVEEILELSRGFSRQSAPIDTRIDPLQFLISRVQFDSFTPLQRRYISKLAMESQGREFDLGHLVNILTGLVKLEEIKITSETEEKPKNN